MAGAFGAALIFIMLLMAEVMLGLFVVCYAGHCFLVVLQETAAGNDEVTWPDEPLQDWVLRGVYLVGMLLIWLVPVGIVRGILISHRVEGDYLIPLLAGGAALLWLFFPISILSSLSGSSRLFLLRTAVLRQLARLPGALIAVYFVSAILLAGWLALVYFTFARGSWLLLPATAVAGSASLLLYARLLGRLSWMLDQLKPVQRQAVRKHKPASGLAADAHDPWATPVQKRRKKKKKSAKSSPSAPPEDVYGMADLPVVRPPSETPLDGFPAIGADTFDMQDAPHALKEESDLAGRSISRGDKDEEILATPTKLTRPPSRPLLEGVYTFPWYASNRKVLIFLTIGAFLMGTLALLMEPPA